MMSNISQLFKKYALLVKTKIKIKNEAGMTK